MTSPILIDFPQYASNQKCTPTSSQGVYYCYYNLTSSTTARNRVTLVLNGYKLERVGISENSYNQGYDFSTAEVLEYVKIYNEYTDVIFPVISIFSIFLIIFFVYKITIGRFIK